MKSILAAVLLFIAAISINAANPVHVEPVLNETLENTGPDAAAVHEEHGLPLHPVEVFNIAGFPITNSMVVTWIVAIALIVFAQIATRNIKRIPEGAQNFWEFLVESLYKFLENI